MGGSMNDSLRQKLLEKNKKTPIKAKEVELLEGMLELADNPFTRTMTQSMSKGKPKFNGSWSRFSQRQNAVYDPAKKLSDPGVWDVKKPDLLNFLKKHQDQIASHGGLIEGLQNLKGVTGFNNKWPQNQKHTVGPNKYVYNDYHTKATAPGYNRNYENNGKPFFS
jgi:hypothetical protein